MATSQLGLLSSTDLVILMDVCGSYLKYLKPAHGQGLPGESTIPSLAYQALLGQTNILGDGGSIYGVGNATAQSNLKDKLTLLFTSSRYEVYASQQLRTIILEIQQEISTYLPKYLNASNVTTQLVMSGGSLQVLDAYLTRLNANSALTPATPTGTPTLTTTTGGTLPNSTSGSCMCYTFVGASDWLESQPSASSTQVAISGANNAYTIGGLATIPAGVTKIRVYRSLQGTTTPFYYDRDIVVSVGSPPTTQKFIAPDITLTQSWLPPVWCSTLILPETALAYAICNMSPGNNPQDSYKVSATGLLQPSNVSLGQVNGILGYNNPLSSGRFANWSAGTSTYGSIITSNDTTQGLQGFAGAFQLQARTYSVMDANASISAIAYSYVTAASPNTPLTSTIAGPFTLNLADGSIIGITVPGGQLVKSVTSITVSGPTTGSFVIEASPLRVI